jgi:hypothetical protein
VALARHVVRVTRRAHQPRRGVLRGIRTQPGATDRAGEQRRDVGQHAVHPTTRGPNPFGAGLVRRLGWGGAPVVRRPARAGACRRRTASKEYRRVCPTPDHRVRRRRAPPGAGRHHGGRPVRGRPAHRRRPHRRGIARPHPRARRRRRGGGRRHRQRRRPVCAPALLRPRHGAGRPGDQPAGQARDRSAGAGRVLLRLRRRRALHPRRPEEDREGDAADRQRGADVLAAGRRRRGGAPGAGGRAVQARAHRAQGRRHERDAGRRRRGLRRGRRGRRGRADDLRQPAPGRQPRLGRPVPRPAHPDHQAHRQRRSR